MSLGPPPFQHTITYGVPILLMLCYWVCGVVCRKTWRFEDILTFGALCGGAVVGLQFSYDILRSQDSGISLNLALVVCAFSLVSAQRAFTLFRAVFRKNRGKSSMADAQH
jgi:hypothetical protein